MVDYKVVAIGVQGAGKTSLFNKICKTKANVSGGINSCTDLITSAQSKYGEAFTMVDTPGISFYKNLFENTISIVAALTDGDVHKILLVIKYDYRIDTIFESITRILNLVKRYQHLLGVVITHFDQCQENKNKVQIEIKDQVTKQFKIDMVLFSGKDTQASDLCLSIFNNLYTQGQKLEISEKRFNDMLKNFKFDDQLEEAKKTIIIKIEQFSITIKNYIEQFDTNIEKSDQILNSLLIFIRNEQEIMLKNFEEKYGPQMHQKYVQTNNPFESYYYHYIIKFNIKLRIQELIDLINQKMVYPENHPYRQLRRCPKCRTIWLKVYGCKDTHCGNRLNRGEIDEVFQNQNYYEYSFKFKNEQELQYEHITPQSLDDTCATINYQSQQLQQLQQSQQLQQPQQTQQLSFPLESQQIQNYDSDYSLIILQPQQQQKLLETSVKIAGQQNQLLESIQLEQVQEKQHVGCGNSFDWDKAEFVNIEELSLKHEKILGIFSKKDEFYQLEFNYLKDKLIEKAKKEQKKL